MNYHFSISMFLFGCIAASHLLACGDDDLTGTVAPGGECQLDSHCAHQEGREVSCICTDRSSSPLCVVASAAGESCESTGNFQQPCDSSTYCVSGQDGEPTCEPKAAEGQACFSEQCAEGLGCFERTCTQPRGLGEACDPHDEATCAQPYLCPRDTEICTAPAAVGEPCSRWFDRNPCVAGASCSFSKDVCIVPKPDGAPCTENEECVGDLCMFDSKGAGVCKTWDEGSSTRSCGF